MSLVVQLPSPSVGYVGVGLGRREVRVTQECLDRAQVGAALQEVRREGMPEQVRVDALWLEPGARGQPAQDQERARARERAALGVEEELGAVAAVEVRP